jgi:hypothetical protein
MVARQALSKDKPELDGFGFVINGEVGGTPAKLDLTVTADKETLVVTTRVEQAKSGPRRKDTEIHLPLAALKKALMLLDPPNRLLLGSDVYGVDGELPAGGAAVIPAGVPLSKDELQIGGVPVEDDFTPPS